MNEHDNLPLHVTAEVVNFPKSREYTYRVTMRTVVLSAAQQTAKLLDGPDPQRCRVVIIANDAPVVLSTDVSQSQSANNTTTGIPNPVGGLIPQNYPIPIDDMGNDLWISSPLAGANVNRVTVITTHKVRV